jgi:serine/threonine kinase 3
MEMFEGRPPYSEIHPMRAIFMIPTKPPPHFKEESAATAHFKEFLAKCLVKDPNNRPDATSLLEEPFVKSHLNTNLNYLIEQVITQKEINKELGRYIFFVQLGKFSIYLLL